MHRAPALFVLSIAACTPVSQPAYQGLSASESLGHSDQSSRVAAPAPAPSDLLVTTEQTCPPGRSCDIVAVIDVHTSASSEEKGFEELRAMARAKRADAVIGAEFEHGEGDNPSHLSAVLVRYGNPVPPHTVLGEIEVPSDGNDRDKGLTQLMSRAYAMSGDQVIDVTFEHGEDGKKGVLKGVVIRFDR